MSKQCSAAIVVTGTEVVTGRIADRNGPWLSRQLLGYGVDTKSIVIVGDRPDDVLCALKQQQAIGVDLIITTGGLGPTADDKTMALVAEFAGKEHVYDRQTHDEIMVIIEQISKRWSASHRQALQEGAKKQAHVPRDAEILAPVGTAPGCIIASQDNVPTIVVLPGPPRELQPMWQRACESALLQTLFQRSRGLRERKLRLFGVPESTLASTLRSVEAQAGSGFGQLEITTCLHRGEIEVVVRFEPQEQELYNWFEQALHAFHPRELFSFDEKTIDQHIADLLDIPEQKTLATAESCTGGLLAARLTDLPGSSKRFYGGAVTYSNALKEQLLGVPKTLLRKEGAVSEAIAAAMALGARERFGVDFAVATTGVAGPDGGSFEKPVGLVWFAVAGPQGTLTLKHQLPGSRADIRERSTTVALHLLRRALLEGFGKMEKPL